MFKTFRENSVIFAIKLLGILYYIVLIFARQSDWPAHLVRCSIWIRVIYTCTKWQHPSPEKAAGDTLRFFEVACGSRQPSSDQLRIHVFRGAVQDPLGIRAATPLGA